MSSGISRPSSAERMASCAASSNSFRSSRLYSACVFVPAVRTVEVSNGGDIALLAPAKDECAPAASYYVAIDPLPKCNKVISRREQRQRNHEPDREICDPVHGKNIRPYRPYLPAMVKNDGNHRHDLNAHLQFAQITGLNGKSF